MRARVRFCWNNQLTIDLPVRPLLPLLQRELDQCFSRRVRGTSKILMEQKSSEEMSDYVVLVYMVSRTQKINFVYPQRSMSIPTNNSQTIEFPERHLRIIHRENSHERPLGRHLSDVCICARDRDTKSRRRRAAATLSGYSILANISVSASSRPHVRHKTSVCTRLTDRQIVRGTKQVTQRRGK